MGSFGQYWYIGETQIVLSLIITWINKNPKYEFSSVGNKYCFGVMKELA